MAVEDDVTSIGELERSIRVAVVFLYAQLRARITVDTRALAALRILLGTTLLLDLLHRSQDLARFYTDAGVYPLAVYEASFSRYTGLSIHALSGELWVQQLLFVIAGLLALALILGYRSRLVALASLILLFSLHARNPAVLNGGDRLLRVLLLVAILTPLGERWSIDALRRGRARRQVAGVTTAALLAQPLAVFTSNAIQKHRGDTWVEGEGLQIALANDVMTVYLGDFLHEFPLLLEPLNWAWVILLSGSVLFLFLPVGRLRAAFALIYIGAFMGMVTSLAIGFFPLILIASVIPFLPAVFWDGLARYCPDRVREVETRVHAAQRRLPPSLERRVLDGLEVRGYTSLASAIVGIGKGVLVVLGCLVLIWIVLYTAADITANEVPEPVHHEVLDDQRWGLYAPNPSTAYSWFAIEATMADGETMDPFTGQPVTADRPPDAAAEYDSFRERKFLETVRISGRGDRRGMIAVSYADWVCREADRATERDVAQITIHRFIQPSPIDGTYDDVVERELIAQEC